MMRIAQSVRRDGSKHEARSAGLRPYALLALAVAMLATAVVAAPVHAAKITDSFIGTAASGTTGGLFNAPRDIAVRESTGQIFVVDSSNHRIQRFSAAGEFERAWGADVIVNGSASDPGSSVGFQICTVAAHCKAGVSSPGNAGDNLRNGAMNNPQGVALNQATGDVYVRDRGNNRVNQYDADGTFVRSWGWDVRLDSPVGTPAFEVCEAADRCKIGVAGAANGQFGSSFSVMTGIDVHAGTGDVFVADPTNRRVQQFQNDGGFVRTLGAAGSEVGQFAANQPVHLAVGDAGVLYVSDGNGNRIQRYDLSTDTFLAPIVSPPLLAGTTGGLEVDPTTGNLLVLRDPSAAGEDTVVQELTPAGALVDTHAQGAGLAGVNGLGVNGASGELFVSTSSNPSGHRVWVFDDDGAEPRPTATINPPQDVGAQSARLEGVVNPNGSQFATSYRFEVSKNGVTWTPVGADTDLGNGTAPVVVGQDVDGLEANTSYRVRIVATREFGAGATISPELTFLTDRVVPGVSETSAQRQAETSAQLVGTVNPNNLPTTYWFEYGTTTAYGATVPAPPASAGSGGFGVRVVESIGGLAPSTTYHFRLVASNAEGTTVGPDVTFTTRAVSAVAAPEGRAYEMVTAPDKPLRQGHAGKGGADVLDFARAQPAVPSIDGSSVKWTLFPGATSGEAGHAFTWADTHEIYRRTADRWRAESVTNVAPPFGATNAYLDPAGTSVDLNTSTWYTQTPMFASGANQAVRVMGDSGGPRGAGWYPWLDPAWYAGGFQANTSWETRIQDDGERLVGYPMAGAVDSETRFHTVTPADGGLAPNQLTPPQSSGFALFEASADSQWAPADLVNECTSTPAQTRLIARDDAGTPGVAGDDVIADRGCAQGSPTDVRGAALQGRAHLDSSSITAQSDAGDRVFFVSPDPEPDDQPELTDQYCGAGTGAATACPAQLFVRQRADDGTVMTRWLSRAESALFDAPQSIDLAGHGVAFEGASRDGRVVYFRTNAPLTADDPNGDALAARPVTTGTASPNSWDLYRYDLGTDNNSDPAPADGDPGDRLTRISGGPDGNADPNTNCAVIATSGHQAGNCWGTLGSGPVPGRTSPPNGAGAAVRFMSDDGNRTYFVTAAAIPGANNAPPRDGATTPTAPTDQINGETRNLYLYDADKTGAAAYEFVARLPYSSSNSSSGDLDSCATFSATHSGPAMLTEGGANSLQLRANTSCVHGSTSGDAVVFQTTGRLTSDDVDAAADVYLYEARSDRLVRVTAPPAGSTPYGCQRNTPTSPVLARCNGDLGVTNGPAAEYDDSFGSAGFRHWNVAEHPDGSLKAVYFESRHALDPNDVNGAGEVADTGGEGVMDVYEWRDGDVRLISPGTTPNSAFYSGNSRDGKRVFFWTEQRISPWEIDVADGDLYAAAEGGGFAPPPQQPAAPCAVLGGACQGGGAGPVPTAPRTSAQGGPAGDNASLGARMILTISGLSAKARRRASRTGKLVLSVQTTAAGTVRATARGRIGRRVRQVARRSTRVRRAGKATLRLRLNNAARKRLRSGKALQLSIRVTSAGARSRTMRVRLPGASS